MYESKNIFLKGKSFRFIGYRFSKAIQFRTLRLFVRIGLKLFDNRIRIELNNLFDNRISIYCIETYISKESL